MMRLCDRRRWFSRLFIGGLLTGTWLPVGCKSLQKCDCPPPPPEPTVSQYHAAEFSWANVARVLALPILNESTYTRAGDELGRALATELQQVARFEVVAAPPGSSPVISAVTHRAGRFDEAAMLSIGSATRADVIIHGTITQYSPYPRPRLGLVLQAVSPLDGKVIGSVDGVWDSAQRPVEVRAKLYYHHLPARHPWIANHRIGPDDGYADEMALESPYLFQRFVCHEAVRLLVADAAGLAAGP